MPANSIFDPMNSSALNFWWNEFKMVTYFSQLFSASNWSHFRGSESWHNKHTDKSYKFMESVRGKTKFTKEKNFKRDQE